MVDEGEHCQFYQGVNYTDGIRYEILAARRQAEVGRQVCVSRTTLAKWASRQIPESEVDAFILQLQAVRVAANLTPAQEGLMRSFARKKPGSRIECRRGEWRTIRSCHGKKLIYDMPLTLGKHDQSFDIVLSPLGQAVVDHLSATIERGVK